MSVTLVLIVLAVLFVAYSNGANDNFKGVATLFGSGTCTYRQALALGDDHYARRLPAGPVPGRRTGEAFKGKGLVPDAVTHQPAFLLAVSLGAALTVLLATLTGLPVSTTHALTGGLVGAGLLAAAGRRSTSTPLGKSFVLPLLFSPVVAVLLYGRRLPTVPPGPARQPASRSQTCVCIGKTYEEVQTQPDGRLLLVRTGVVLEVGRAARLRGPLPGAVSWVWRREGAGWVALPQRRRGGLRARPERHAQDRRPDVGRRGAADGHGGLPWWPWSWRWAAS